MHSQTLEASAFEYDYNKL